MTSPPPPFGSAGEHQLQQHLGTADRAARFYDQQVRPHLTAEMREFIGRQSMVFLATSDSHGECDASFRAGPPGFVHVIDDNTLAYPEFRGNGVLASAGNMLENPHLGMLFVDFTHHHVGLHVNGTARLYHDVDLRQLHPGLPTDVAPGRSPHMWVHLTVEEAYIHCSKFIPHLEPAPRPTSHGTARPKDSDYFTKPRTAPCPSLP
ncbi:MULTISPECIES: pyridoxamine 5'-phosphate oxidase family protein [unclassified Streptomyces]|uniref:pyridoxamine 5'-phosphate oxidase family protein n=1 Tax=unclassified Streptomyces TaxID=2593676 RepID=UPI001BE820E9|nr:MULTISPECIES: pyridoxamine 5'-phosphate oxidase family protein [unclassified Streptomyces]MBT2404831.1 pyridoxamine 5'-phosphate oxidase family protein [Streptomyces sp. ISL-21]MBT2612551.1 pyridoxamine 5'-phosphate oxidase family protein [Streptomyces sp. ISL-87]